MNKSSKLVGGIGTKGCTYPTTFNGKMLKEYDIWGSMLLRCTEKCWANYPSYVNTFCSENFKSYTFFYEWCQEQKGFGNKDEKGKYWQLDKDLLVKGNKLYSEDTCVFVPQEINILLIKCDSVRGDSPVGVHWHKKDKKFHSRCSDGFGKQKHLGCFSTAKEAFLAYKNFKEAYIKQVAEQYKDVIDPRAYKALLEYEVNIDD